MHIEDNLMQLTNGFVIRFIEMCFDPQSPMNEKLKETLFRMMEENR